MLCITMLDLQAELVGVVNVRADHHKTKMLIRDRWTKQQVLVCSNKAPNCKGKLYLASAPLKTYKQFSTRCVSWRDKHLKMPNLFSKTFFPKGSRWLSKFLRLWTAEN